MGPDVRPRGCASVSMIWIDPNYVLREAHDLNSVVERLETVAQATRSAWQKVESAAGAGPVAPVAALAARQWPQGLHDVGAAVQTMARAGVEAAKLYAETERHLTAAWGRP